MDIKRPHGSFYRKIKMTKSSYNYLCNSNKVLLFTKNAIISTGYMVYVKDKDKNISVFTLSRDGLIGKYKIDDEHTTETIISLLIDEYKIKTIKNRYSIEIKNSILDKYRRLLKKYYVKNDDELSYVFKRFLHNYLHNNISGLRMNMNKINTMLKVQK